MAKHSMNTKFITKQQVNYREEDEIINKSLSCTELECNEYQTDKDGTIKGRIADMNQKLTSQYRMMQMAHHRYNLLFRWMHEMLMIHQFALLLFKIYLTIQVGMLQRIHHKHYRYDTLIGIESLSSGYLTHRMLDHKILARYLEAITDDMEDTAPDYEPVFTGVYQYYGNSLASFTNTIDDLILQLPMNPCHFIAWTQYLYHWMQKQVQNESTLKYCLKPNTLH